MFFILSLHAQSFYAMKMQIILDKFSYFKHCCISWKGLISNEKRDEFNVPLYAPSVEEFKEVVEAEGSFTINKLELFKGGSPIVVSQPDDRAEVGKALANSCRTVCGVLVDAHIGDRLGNELFSIMASRAASQAEELLEQLQFFHIIASLSPN